MPLAVEVLPQKLRLFAISEDNGSPLVGVPLEAVLSHRTSTGDVVELTLGLLRSNHAGYAAFDLSHTLEALSRENQRLIDQQRKPLEPPQALRVRVPVDPPLLIDLTPHFGGPIAPRLVPVSLPRRTALPVHGDGTRLPSIQNPDLDDWLESPGSFGMDQAPVIVGQGDCEALLPSHAPVRTVRFHQLERNADAVEFPFVPFAPAPGYNGDTMEPEAGWPRQLIYRNGRLHHYELVWLPLNHGLGEVRYSLTLAPCEAVRMAVVDWSRTDEGVRGDRVNLSDNLTHSMRRDRTVEEVVDAVLRERQSGESFMGGMAGVGGYGGGMGGGGMGMPGGSASATPASGGAGGGSASPGGASGGGGGGQQAGQNWGVTGSHALGYAMANSSGDRDVDVETTQTLLDDISQASQLVRDLRSTVIVQANQRERETVQTRIVRNHNHSHALTVLYYEVVRHYLVRTLLKRTDPVIFVKYPLVTFDQSVETRTLLRRRSAVLRGRLLDIRFATGFDALYPVNDSDFIGTGGARVMGLVVKLRTGGDDSKHDRLQLLVVRLDGRPIIKHLGLGFSVVPHYFNGGPRDGLFVDQLYNSGASNTFFVDLTHPGRYAPEEPPEAVGTEVISPFDLKQIGFVHNRDGDDDWDFESMTVHAAIQFFDNMGEHRELVQILDTQSAGIAPFKVRSHGDWVWDIDLVEASRRLREARDRASALVELINHLDARRLHYNSILWLSENAGERAQRFEHYRLGDRPLIDLIDNQPVDVVGDYVAFPLAEKGKATSIVTGQRIVSLPTRGAFAETKLSHCNASEIIDDTRFWDWQQSPCPDEPTEILPVATGSRRESMDLRPTPLPETGVGITEPQAAPEPFGMREVMTLLRTPDIFRDMSGIAELGTLLGKLVEVAGEVEKARIGATTTLATAGQQPAEATASGNAAAESSRAASSAGDRRALAQTARRELAQLRDSGAITPEQFNSLSYRSAESAFVPNAGSDDGLFGPRQSGSDLTGMIRTAVDDGRGVDLRQGEESLRIEPVQFPQTRSARREESVTALVPMILGDLLYERLTRLAYRDGPDAYTSEERDWLVAHSLEHANFFSGPHDFQYHSFRRAGGADTMPIIAFRGSGTRLRELWDWVLDLGWDTSSVGHTPFHANFEQVQEEIRRLGGAVDVTGHSLGGGIAQLTAVYAPAQVRRVVTFSAPACSTFNMRSLLRYQRWNPTVNLPHSVHWAQRWDVVPQAGNYFTPGVRIVVNTPQEPGAAHSQQLLQTLAQLRETDPDYFQSIVATVERIGLPAL